MSSRTISPLDKIIRKTEKGLPVPPDHRILYYDEKNKRILLKEPSFLQTFGRKINSYIVSANETVNGDGFAFALDNGISLNVAYTAKCTLENEDKLLTSLFDESNTFEHTLHQKLKQYLRQFVSENADTISHLFLHNCETEIRKRCLADTGLLLKPSVTFQAEGNLKEINLKSGSFVARLVDYKHPVNIEFDISIQADEKYLEKCLLELPVANEMTNMIKEIVKTQIWEKTTLNQFCLALNLSPNNVTDFQQMKSVKEVLTEPINNFLRSKGRKIGYLHLSSTSVENITPKSQIDIEHICQYRILDENELVTIKSNVSLKSKDIGAFKRAEERYNIQKSKPDYIEEWFKSTVIVPLIKDILFNKKYKDILLHPESIKENIKDDITKKAEEIGYSISLHTHLPDIKKLKFREGFTISMLDEEFETKSADVKIKLNVTIKGKISNLEKLDESLLQPYADIDAEMKLEIRSAIEDIIHRMDPEQIYLRFSFDPLENKPVDEILSDVVTDKLYKKFNVERSSLRNIIKLSQVEDELIKKSAALRKDLRKFEMTVYPTKKDAYIEPLVYEIQYKIMGVAQSGWPIFLSRISKEVESQFLELEKYLEALIEEKLNSIDYATLKSENVEIKDKIKIGLEIYASALVAKKFGLSLSFYTFLRKRSVTELKAIETALEMHALEEKALVEIKKQDIDNLFKNLGTLHERGTEAIEREDLDGAKEFRKQIEELKKDNENIIPAIGNIRRQIEDSKNDNNDLDNLFSLPTNLLGNSTNEEISNS